MELGDKHLKVQRASIGATQASGLEMGVNAMSMLAGTTSNDLEEGRVLQLLNMVTPEELIDNADYEGMRIDPNPFFDLLTKIRNLRRRQRRMREIWPSPRDESPPTQRRQQAIQRCRQDLRQVRQCGFCAQGVAGVGREEVCRSDCRDYIFC